jgi:predicted membrane protein
MEFNLKYDFKNGPSSKKAIFSAVGNFWQKIYMSIFFIFLICAVAFGVYVWRNSLSGGQWSEEKKQEYIKAQSSGVSFNENDFKKASEDIDFRKQENIGNQEPIRDIFKAY